MALPIVAIVGRPNVGKSSLFNWLAGRRISIVDPTAGVTRDRITTILQVEDRYFELMDTGGMGIQDHDNLTEDVEHQIRLAIEQATIVLFLVDIRDGVVPLDELVAQRLRSVNRPVIFVANKADDMKLDVGLSDFFRLGYGEPILASAEQKRGKEYIVDAILKLLPTTADNREPVDVALKLAIVGRRNVGKSTFINSLAQADRVIVSEIPGTTRDSIDVRFERDEKVFLAIDTAGVRKKKSMGTDIEYYSSHRAERSIRRADVVLHFFDPRLRVSRVDKQLCEYILDNHKPAIFVVNKWDLAKDTIPTGKWTTYLREVFPMMDYVPVAFVTAKEGKNVYRLLNLAQSLHKQSARRAKTGELNRVLQAALLANSPPLRENRQPRIYYATQVGTNPPTIVLVSNAPDLFDGTYLRYLLKTLRDHFPFREVPIRLVMRSREDVRGNNGRVEYTLTDSGKAEDTDIVPRLAAEIPVDALESVFIDEEELAPQTPQSAPAKKPQPEIVRPKKKKKKKTPDTWEL
jgi:GTPase